METFSITNKGIKYLDRVMGSAIKMGPEAQRKERILSLIEYLGGSADFDQIWEDSHRTSPIVVPGSEYDFLNTARRLVGEGYLELV